MGESPPAPPSVPDPTLMSQDQIDFFVKWMERWWKEERRACPICDHKRWVASRHFLHGDLVGPKQFQKNFLFNLVASQGVPYVPMCAVFCEQCGHVRLFNASMMKLPGLDGGEEATRGG